MKAFFVFTLMMVMVVFCSAAHSWGVIEKGPYLQNVGKRHITIMWESLYATKSRVDYGMTKDYDLFVEDPKEVELHEVTLRPLRPGMKYYYKITCGLTTKTGNFRTAPAQDTPVKFTVYGDSRTNSDIHRDIAKEMLAENPDFILHVGDLVTNGKRDYQWESWFFDPLYDVINHIPIFTCLGNHEANSRDYLDLFSLPSNELWYSFDYSNCHFTILDTNKEYGKGSNQYKWLKNDLSQMRAGWKFVLFHHPPYSSGAHGSTLKARNVLTPLFRKYGVDIVFAGHEHIYERSYPIDSAFELDSSPVTYVVTGGGGADLHNAGRNIWTVASEKTYNFCVLSLDGDKLEFKALNENGKRIDEFSIDKRKGKYQEYTKDKLFFEIIEFQRMLPSIVTPPVVLLESGRTQAQDVIKIKNIFPEAVDFTITWHSLGNWDVSPERTVVRIGGNETKQIPFTFRFPNTDIWWPPPTFSIAYDTGIYSGEIADNYLRALSFKRLSCGKAGGSVEIDGRMKERFWKSISPANGFIRSDFSGLATKQTTAKAAYGKNALYFAIVCREPESKSLSATISKRDGDIINDEAVIVSLAPHGDENMVYQFGVNCDGVEYDAKGGVKEWNGKWESATQFNDGNWTVEMAIPYSVLELSSAPKKGEEWKINFFRSTTGSPEKSEWSATLESPLAIERLGILTMN